VIIIAVWFVKGLRQAFAMPPGIGIEAFISAYPRIALVSFGYVAPALTGMSACCTWHILGPCHPSVSAVHSDLSFPSGQVQSGWLSLKRSSLWSIQVET